MRYFTARDTEVRRLMTLGLDAFAASEIDMLNQLDQFLSTGGDPRTALVNYFRYRAGLLIERGAPNENRDRNQTE